MKESTHKYLNPSSNNYRSQSTPKKKSFPITQIKNNYHFNFNYLTKPPSSYINVFCRIRPLNELELLYSKKEAIKIRSTNHLLLYPEHSIRKPEEFYFDELFEPNIHISSFYNKTIKNIVKYSMEGFNGGIIIYGDSGSGKTYVIKEIMPQIIRQIFEIIYTNKELFNIEIAIYEIYKEQINDLIKKDNINLNLIELKNKKAIINDLTYIRINNEEELNNLFNKGMNNKDKSIKSHFVIELKLYRYYKDKNIMKYAKLIVAELQGTECCSKESEISEEQKNIYKSIEALKMVVKRLNDRNGKDKDEDEIHIPYRNSKLTRILSDCFGGNCFTSLILTCSKSEYHINHTKNILLFGKNARKIKNSPLINVEVNANKNTIMKRILNEEDDKEKLYKINKLNLSEEKLNELKERIERGKKEINNTSEIYNDKNNNFESKDYNNIISPENGELNNRYNNKNSSSPRNFYNKLLKNKIILSEDNNPNNKNNYKKSPKYNININDIFIDKKYYNEKIEQSRKEIKELQSLLKEKEKYITELKSDLEDKKSEILILQLDKEKIINKYEDKLDEKNEKIKFIEEKNISDKINMENNLYNQIKNSEVIIRELRESKKNSEEMILKYKNNIEQSNLKIKEIENKYRKLNEEKDNKINDLQLELNNYKIKISQLTNDIFLKDSTVKKMNGEIQILKTELKNNEQKIIDEKVQKKNEDNININNLEIKLKESKNSIDEYENKFNLINKELNEAKNMIIILNKEKEDLINQNLDNNKKDKEYVNEEKERELNLLKKMIQNLQKDNEMLRNKMNDYEEIKQELECYKNRGNNYNYIEINKSTLKEKYDKLIEENKQLKDNLIKDDDK